MRRVTITVDRRPGGRGWITLENIPAPEQEPTPTSRPDDHVAFRVAGLVTNDLRILFAAAGTGLTVTWYTRAQMTFMAVAGGPQWEQFSKGPAFIFSPRS